MQSFLESLNYYSLFIEVFAIHASALYEWRKADFHEIRCSYNTEVEGPPSYDHGHYTEIDNDSGQRPTGDHDHPLVTTNGQVPSKVKDSDGEHTVALRWEKPISRSPYRRLK